MNYDTRLEMWDSVMEGITLARKSHHPLTLCGLNGVNIAAN